MSFERNFGEEEDFDLSGNDPAIEMIAKMMKEYTKTPRIRMLNLQRMVDMVRVKKVLEKNQLENGERPHVIFRDDDVLPGICSLSVESGLVILNSKLQLEILALADNVEVVPLTNGNIQMNITFCNVYDVRRIEA